MPAVDICAPAKHVVKIALLCRVSVPPSGMIRSRIVRKSTHGRVHRRHKLSRMTNIKIHTSNQRRATVYLYGLNKKKYCGEWLWRGGRGSMKLGSRTEIMNICTFFMCLPPRCRADVDREVLCQSPGRDHGHAGVSGFSPQKSTGLPAHDLHIEDLGTWSTGYTIADMQRQQMFLPGVAVSGIRRLIPVFELHPSR